MYFMQAPVILKEEYSTLEGIILVTLLGTPSFL